MKNQTLKYFLVLSLGIAVGGYIFYGVQSREIIAVKSINKIKYNELAGLISSVGIRTAPILIPKVMETDKTIVIKHPKPEKPIHLVIIPKRDIKDAGDISDGDGEYLIDSYAVISKLIKKHNLKKYKVVTNGPAFQHTTYLHFHLIGSK